MRGQRSWPVSDGLARVQGALRWDKGSVESLGVKVRREAGDGEIMVGVCYRSR